MAPFQYSRNSRPDVGRHCPHDAHFTHAGRVPGCNHCTYFKGIVYHSISRRQLSGDDEATVRHDNMTKQPRSLLSVALEEEAIEKREHTKYMAWSKSLVDVVATSQSRSVNETARSTGLNATESNTLRRWIEGSTKDQLLAWLERNGDESDDMSILLREGIFDLREYMMNKRNRKKVAKVQKTPAARSDRASADLTKPSSCTKSGGPHRDTIEQRLQAHRSLKPPQAALRERDELRRWYDSKRAPELKDELRHRGIRPVPSKKVDLVRSLVEDDKKVS